ncbi:unnamed protein product [Sympodiomycopsis kandeliae]
MHPIVTTVIATAQVSLIGTSISLLTRTGRKRLSQWTQDYQIVISNTINLVSCLLTVLITLIENISYKYLLLCLLLSVSLRVFKNESGNKFDSLVAMVRLLVLPLIVHFTLITTLNDDSSSPRGYHLISGHPLPPLSSSSRYKLPGGRLDWDLPDTHHQEEQQYTFLQVMTIVFIGVWAQTFWYWFLFVKEHSEQICHWGTSILPIAKGKGQRRD